MKIIVEGLWALGKTTICEYLQNRHDFVFIQEPDHKKQTAPVGDLDDWYIKEHTKNFEKLVQLSGGAIMERSVISTLAFMHARDKSDRCTKKYLECIRPKAYEAIDMFIVVDISAADYKKRILTLENIGLKEFLFTNSGFIDSYMPNLFYYAGKIFGEEKIIPIRTFENGMFINQNNVFYNLRKTLKLHEEKK